MTIFGFHHSADYWILYKTYWHIIILNLDAGPCDNVHPTPGVQSLQDLLLPCCHVLQAVEPAPQLCPLPQSPDVSHSQVPVLLPVVLVCWHLCKKFKSPVHEVEDWHQVQTECSLILGFQTNKILAKTAVKHKHYHILFNSKIFIFRLKAEQATPQTCTEFQ